jgi:hypothetical protein
MKKIYIIVFILFNAGAAFGQVYDGFKNEMSFAKNKINMPQSEFHMAFENKLLHMKLIIYLNMWTDLMSPPNSRLLSCRGKRHLPTV